MRCLLASLALWVGAASAGADVVPSSYPEARGPRDAVVRRLDALGARDAEQRVRRMSDVDAAYFAAEPARVQSAGGEYGTTEMMLGLFFLIGGFVATYFYFAD